MFASLDMLHYTVLLTYANIINITLAASGH